jgi:hypothetical protein
VLPRSKRHSTTEVIIPIIPEVVMVAVELTGGEAGMEAVAMADTTTISIVGMVAGVDRLEEEETSTTMGRLVVVVVRVLEEVVVVKVLVGVVVL